MYRTRCCRWAASCTERYTSQFKDSYLAETWSGSEEGSYSRLIDGCITHSRLEGNNEENERWYLDELVVIAGVPRRLLRRQERRRSPELQPRTSASVACRANTGIPRP